MDQLPCTDIHGPQRMILHNVTEEWVWARGLTERLAMMVGWSVHCGPDWNIWTIIWGTAMKFHTDIHSPQRMNPTDFGDPLSFPLAPPWGWYLCYSVKCLNNYQMDCHEMCTDIYAPLRMSCNNFGHLLTNPLAPSSGLICSVLLFMTKHLLN